MASRDWYSHCSWPPSVSLYGKICGLDPEKILNRTINIYPIRNDFFGESITVSGLITAKRSDRPAEG